MRSQVLISDKSSNDYVFAIFNPGSSTKTTLQRWFFLCFLFAHVKKSLYFCRGKGMKRCRYIVFLLLAGMVGQGCSSRALHEAEAVVAQADSLWQVGLMYGIDAGDSLSLAQAYETLGAYQFLSPFTFHPSSSFTHACYHYGKLLRAKDDPENAMRCFINATHSRTHDYHILGRVYSNMGDLCHLAGDFQLSYRFPTLVRYVRAFRANVPTQWRFSIIFL